MEDKVQELLEKSLPNIVESLGREIKEQVKSNIHYTVEKEIEVAVEGWVKKNIIPEIIKRLVESKEGLISAATKSTGEMSELLAKSMIKHLKEKLENSWDRRKIFDTMFKD